MGISVEFSGFSATARSGAQAPKLALFAPDGSLETTNDALPRFLARRRVEETFVEALRGELPAGVASFNAAPFSKQWVHQGEVFDVHWMPLIDGRWLATVTAATPTPETTAKAHPETDALTGLLSRAGLSDVYDAMRRQIDDDVSQLFCLYLDLDRFKQVNDTLGHAAGDTLLKKVARRLKGCVRDRDRVFRLGGDEFLVLGHAEQPAETARSMAERIIDHVSRPYLLSGNQAVIGASVGIARLDPSGSAETLLKHADLALYDSKRTGRGKLSFYSNSMESQADLRRDLDIALRQALVVGSFEVHFQPQINVDGTGIEAFEALLRLRNSDGSLQDAGSFLELAEETRLIVRIGQFVLSETIKAVRQWPEPIRASVNISQVELQHGELAQDLEAFLTEHGVDPARLDIEVKEALLSDPCPVTLQTLKQIADLGVRLVIDRLGDDVSTADRLFHLGIGAVKLNKARLQTEPADREKAKLAALAALARAAGAQVVASGIETDAQLDFARQIGCDTAQGFLLHEPLPLDRTLNLIETCATRGTPTP